MKAADGLLKETEIEHLSFHIMYTNKMEQGHRQGHRDTDRDTARRIDNGRMLEKEHVLWSGGSRDFFEALELVIPIA